MINNFTSNRQIDTQWPTCDPLKGHLVKKVKPQSIYKATLGKQKNEIDYISGVDGYILHYSVIKYKDWRNSA